MTSEKHSLAPPRPWETASGRSFGVDVVHAGEIVATAFGKTEGAATLRARVIRSALVKDEEKRPRTRGAPRA